MLSLVGWEMVIRTSGIRNAKATRCVRCENLIGRLRAEKQLLEKKYNGQDVDLMTGELTDASN